MMTKLTAFLVILLTANPIFANKVNSQNLGTTKVSFSVEDATLLEIFESFEQQTTFRFLYDSDISTIQTKYSYEIGKVSMRDALRLLSKDARLKFNQVNRSISVKKVPPTIKKIAAPILIEIKGKVTDASGYPLPGASVTVKGTGVGTTADFDGNFTLEIPDDAEILVVSYIGFKTQEISIDGKTDFTIVMNFDNTLEEVVVTAYGTQTKESIVGSVSVVSAEVLDDIKATSVTQALQGTVAGVTVITPGGVPGTNPIIRIRGVGSINAAADPLIIVDGVRFTGNLNTISQDQIESFSVLKDASATALYGASAANGVVIITTKSGKLNAESAISVSAKSGIGAPAVDLHSTLGIDQWSELYWEAKYNKGLYVDRLSESEAATFASDNFILDLGYNPYGVEKPVNNEGKVIAKPLWDTNWRKAIINEATNFSDIGVQLSGGGQKTSYFFSTNYLTEEGSVVTTKFDRYSSRVKVESQVTDWIKVGVNTSYTISKTNAPLQSGSLRHSAIHWTYTMPNVYPIYRRAEDGSFIKDSTGDKIFDYGSNPGVSINGSRPLYRNENAYGSLFLYDNETKRTNFNTILSASLKLTDFLSFNSNLSFQEYMYDYYQYIDRDYGYASEVNGRINQSRNITTQTEAIQQLLFKPDFNNDHSVKASVLYISNNYEFDSFSAQGSGFLPGIKVLGGATNVSDLDGYTEQQRFTNLLGRVRYNYGAKYFIEGSINQGLSSKFNKPVRRGTFYSIGGSWVLSKENFMSRFDKINHLKLRLSYGEVGNDRSIGSFPYVSLFEAGMNQLDAPGVLAGDLIDPLLTWEKTALSNIGLEFTLFNSKIDGSVEYYVRESLDLIYDKPLPPSTGNNGVTTNVGALKNYGLEFNLTTKIIDKNDFKLKTSFNVATLKNEITELSQEEFTKGTKRWKVGKSLYEFFMREYAGVDPLNGNVLWYQDILDEKGNSTGKRNVTENYSKATRYYTGKQSLPDLTGGISLDINYKRFDFSVLANYSFGAYVYDYIYAGLLSSFDRVEQGHKDLLRRWRKPGDITDVPMMLRSNNDFNAPSTRFLFKNDYVRIKTLTLGYAFDENLTQKVGIKKGRVYLQAFNPFTFHSHFGIDPEQNLGGTTRNRSYLLRTYTLGVNIEL